MPTSPEHFSIRKYQLATWLAVGAITIGSAAKAQGVPEAPSNQPTKEKTADWPLADRVDSDKIIIPSEVMKHSTKTLPYILKRIGGCESNAGPNSKIDYRAQNPTSTASGGFQFLDSTWSNFRGYVKAKHAPHTVQNEKAKIVLKEQGTVPWNASKSCWG